MNNIGQSIQLHGDQADQSNLGDKIDSISSEISERIPQGTLAGSNGNDMIATATSALEHLHTSNVSMPIMRAYSPAHNEKLEHALKNAMKAIESQPTSPDGYVIAGDIYTMQGKQKAAIEILESGLRLVLPSEQALLYERLAVAKKLLDQGIDFMTILPIEVVVNIFTRLDDDMVLINCTVVSKLWRRTLLQRCPELWRTAIFDLYSPWNPAAQLLPLITSHVQNLEVQGDNDGIIVRMLAEMVRANQNFPSLTSLTIVTSSPMTMMSLLGETLISITICIQVDTEMRYLTNDYTDEENLPLDSILTLCPNLKDLSITSDEAITYRRPEILPLNGYQLTSLVIESMYYMVPVIENLIPDCPHLEMLCAFQLSPTILPLLEQHCPRFGRLTSIKEPPTNKFISTKYLSNSNCGQSGLHTLQYSIPHKQHIQPTISIMAKNTKTLTTLDLKMHSPDDYQEGLEQIATIELNHVKNLGLSISYNNGSAQQFGSFVAAVIQHCPALEAVIVDFDFIPLPDQFFMCLSTHRQLHTLEIRGVESYTSGFQQLLTHLSELGSQCMLKNVTVQSSKIVNDELLNTLTDIQTLQTIKIECHRFYDNVTAKGIAAFAHKLKALPRLTELCLRAMPHITNSILCQLAGINGLQTLILTDMDDITTSGMLAMADGLCSSLKTVTVSGHQVDRSADTYLQKAISR